MVTVEWKFISFSRKPIKLMSCQQQTQSFFIHMKNEQGSESINTEQRCNDANVEQTISEAETRIKVAERALELEREKDPASRQRDRSISGNRFTRRRQIVKLRRGEETKRGREGKVIAGPTC